MMASIVARGGGLAPSPRMVGRSSPAPAVVSADNDGGWVAPALRIADRVKRAPLADPTAVRGGARAKPLRAYPGSKDGSGLAVRICALFPHHTRYIEPFLGGGAVLRAKRPALCSIGIDDDADVVHAWWRSGWPGLDVQRGCGIEWLEAAALWLTEYDLVYCDPPYVLSTRSRKRFYKSEWTDRKHKRFLAACLRLPCSVFISGYDSELYRSMLTGWRVESFPSMTRGGRRTEMLWCRTTMASFVDGSWVGVDARAVGGDYRERERIKKKAARWVRMLGAMPAPERAAVLQACLYANGDRPSTPAAVLPAASSAPVVGDPE
jgi:hypothetical protein